MSALKPGTNATVPDVVPSSGSPGGGTAEWNRRCCTFGFLLGVSFAFAAPTVSVNGNVVRVPLVTRDGSVYADAQALARALGASVTYDKARNQLVIVTDRAGAAGNGQLDGNRSKLGQTSTLGKRSPLNVTLRSAAYSIRPFSVGLTTVVPEAGEKLLVLRYSIQNPQKSDVPYYWGSVRFTAVDPQDRNHTLNFNVAREGTTDALQVTLKPAQKIDAVAVLKVPANLPIHKLLVERGEENTTSILRYDLKGNVAALPAPFAEPSDPSGATARDVIPASVRTFYPAPSLDLNVESIALTTQAIAGRTPASGQQFLLITVLVKNTLNRPLDFYWGTLRSEVRGADERVFTWNNQVLGASTDEAVQAQLKPGETRRMRYFYEVPRNEPLTTLSFKEGNGRTYRFSLTGVK